MSASNSRGKGTYSTENDKCGRIAKCMFHEYMHGCFILIKCKDKPELVFSGIRTKITRNAATRLVEDHVPCTIIVHVTC